MKYLANSFVLLLLLFNFLSCSTSSTCLKDKYYKIDFYSTGGFTNVSSGVTIKCNGFLQHWKQMQNSPRVVVDSLALNDKQRIIFDSLITHPELFNYNHEYKGNSVTHLVITGGDKSNNISFDQSNIPQDMPKVMQQLINEIQIINRKN